MGFGAGDEGNEKGRLIDHQCVWSDSTDPVPTS